MRHSDRFQCTKSRMRADPLMHGGHMYGWLGRFRSKQLEAQFVSFDLDIFFWKRVAVGTVLLAIQSFLFAENHRTAYSQWYVVSIYTPSVVTVILALLSTVWVYKVTKAVNGRGGEPPPIATPHRLTSLAHLSHRVNGVSKLWCLAIFLSLLAYQLRVWRICSGTRSRAYGVCLSYEGVTAAIGSGSSTISAGPAMSLYPLLPTLHAVCMLGTLQLLSSDALSNALTITVSFAVLTSQTWTFYRSTATSVSEEAARVSQADSAQVIVLLFTLWLCVMTIGVLWPMHRRIQYGLYTALQAQFEEYKAAAARVQEAEALAKENLEARLAFEQRVRDERSELCRYLFHEIRVPLHTVAMGLQLLGDGSPADEALSTLSPEDHEHISMMQAACNTAVCTLTDALDLITFERSAYAPPVLQPLHLRDFVGSIIAQNMSFAASNRVELTFELCSGRSVQGGQLVALPEWVLADPAGLQQVLTNFVSNSIRFTKKDGQGKVKLAVGWSIPSLLDQDGGQAPFTSTYGDVIAAQHGADNSGFLPYPAKLLQQLHTEAFKNDLTSAGFEIMWPSSVCEDVVAAGSSAALSSMVSAPSSVSTLTQRAHQMNPLATAHASEALATANDSTVDGRRPLTAEIVFAVVDNGVGVSPEEIPKLYQEFKQVEAGMMYKGRGTGLGLAITKNMVRRVQGKVGVHSASGKGSVFYAILRLPILTRRHSTPNVTPSTSNYSPGTALAAHSRSRADSSSYSGLPRMIDTAAGSSGALTVSGTAWVEDSSDHDRDRDQFQERKPHSTFDSGTSAMTAAASASRHPAFMARVEIIGKGITLSRASGYSASPAPPPQPILENTSDGPRRLSGISTTTSKATAAAVESSDVPVALTTAGAGPSVVAAGAVSAASVPDWALMVHVPTTAAPAVLDDMRKGEERGIAILVVDDVVSNRRMLSKLLTKRWETVRVDPASWPVQDFSVGVPGAPSELPTLSSVYGRVSCVEAEDGLQAIQLLQQHGPSYFHAVLMDGSMPVMDGYECTRVMRGKVPSAAHTELQGRLLQAYTGMIFGVTGNAVPADVQAFLDAGVDEVFTKPADVDLLCRKIGRGLFALPRPTHDQSGAKAEEEDA